MRYGAMARSSAQNLCTNGPMQCVLCRDTVWLYGMAHHFDATHSSSTPLSALCVKVDEKEMVVNWSRKKNHSKRSHDEMDAHDGGDIAETSPHATTAPTPSPKTNNIRNIGKIRNIHTILKICNICKVRKIHNIRNIRKITNSTRIGPKRPKMGGMWCFPLYTPAWL